MKIEAKLLASAEDARIKRNRAPNFFIFSTDSEKSLLGPELQLGQTNFSDASASFVCPFPPGEVGFSAKSCHKGSPNRYSVEKKTTITGNS